jgi:hypothetical protein
MQHAASVSVDPHRKGFCISIYSWDKLIKVLRFFLPVAWIERQPCAEKLDTLEGG